MREEPAAEPADGIAASAAIRRIVVDFGERDAVAFARTLVEQTGAELIVADRDAADLREVALLEGADLIVVDRAAGTVPDNAPCAIAVAPGGIAARDFALRTIAVGYDRSRQAAIALELATELAGRAGAELRILGAVEFGPARGGRPPAPDETEMVRMRGALEQASESVPAEVEAEPRLLHGDPRYTLLEEARRADLLVLGSRAQYGRRRRLALGSVAATVTREAHCTTLVATA